MGMAAMAGTKWGTLVCTTALVVLMQFSHSHYFPFSGNRSYPVQAWFHGKGQQKQSQYIEYKPHLKQR